MNKPAPKEPSMDEILSSIRQIIADDDAGSAPRRQPFQPTVASATPAPQPAADFDTDGPAAAQDDEPLTLSADQIVDEPAAEELSPAAVASEDAAEPAPAFVDPEDVAFDTAPEAADVEEDIASFSMPEAAEDEAVADFAPAETAMADTDPVPFPSAHPRSVADTAPMPDPDLSSDLAERLLEPTTDAAVRHTFSRITHMPVGNEGLTLEALMRDMLRPMLKEWLDENLPTVVERMVEKEIARVSRGLE